MDEDREAELIEDLALAIVEKLLADAKVRALARACEVQLGSVASREAFEVAYSIAFRGEVEKLAASVADEHMRIGSVLRQALDSLDSISFPWPLPK